MKQENKTTSIENIITFDADDVVIYKKWNSKLIQHIKGNTSCVIQDGGKGCYLTISFDMDKIEKIKNNCKYSIEMKKYSSDISHIKYHNCKIIEQGSHLKFALLPVNKDGCYYEVVCE